MAKAKPDIVQTTDNAEQDQAALHEGKLVWMGQRVDGETAIFIFYDEIDGYFVKEAVRWRAVGAENYSDVPQFSYADKQWVDAEVLDYSSSDGVLQRNPFLALWQKAKQAVSSGPDAARQ